MSAPASAARSYRMRPAPRARRGGRTGSRIQWDRVGRIALLLVVAAVLLSYVSPILGFVDAWRDSRAERAQLAELRTANAELRERMVRIDDPGAAEREARHLGMVAEGEAPYVVRGLRGD